MNTWPMAENHDVKGKAKSWCLLYGFQSCWTIGREPHGMIWNAVHPVHHHAESSTCTSIPCLPQFEPGSLIDTSRRIRTLFDQQKKSRFAKQQQGGRERRLCPAQRLVDLNGYAKESDGIQGFQNPERSTSKFKFHKIDTCHYQTTLQSTNHLDIFSIFYPPCYCHCQVEGGRWCQSCQTSVIFNQTHHSSWRELRLRLPPTQMTF